MIHIFSFLSCQATVKAYYQVFTLFGLATKFNTYPFPIDGCAILQLKVIIR